MSHMLPSNFSNHEEWISYVRDHVAVAERAYALACGRTELFKSFYEVRKRTFPVEFERGLDRIRVLPEPQRTGDLESLNEHILASLTELLFHEAQPNAVEAAAVAPPPPREQVRELVDHLTQKNPYFALWVVFKGGGAENSNTENWEDYLGRELGTEDGDEVAFARAMAELDKLLLYFHDRDLPLPRHFFERAWFLHYLRGPERMLQTRALLNTLTAETGACKSE